MSEVLPGDSRPRSAPSGTQVDGLLSTLLAIRGVEAAAIVGIDGEYLQGTAADELLLERMVGTVTSALAAGEALAGLLRSPEGQSASGAAAHTSGAKAGAGEVIEGGAEPVSVPGPEGSATVEAGAEGYRAAQHQLMVMYQDGGPILFTPLVGGERLAVVALRTSHDIGRVRFQLRSVAAEGS